MNMARRILAAAAMVCAAWALAGCSSKPIPNETKPVDAGNGPSQPVAAGATAPGGAGAAGGGQSTAAGAK